jgi:hypothetical protein
MSSALDSSSLSQVEDHHWGTEPRFEFGAALQQSDALPTEPRRTLTEPRCTLWATPNPTETRRTLEDNWVVS